MVVSFIGWLESEHFLRIFYQRQRNIYIPDNSRFYTKVSHRIIWVYSAYTMAMALLTCSWHLLTVIILSFLFMTRIFCSRQIYLPSNRFQKSERSHFFLNVFYIRCNASECITNHYKSLNLCCTYTIWLFTASQQILFVEFSVFSVVASQLLFLAEK